MSDTAQSGTATQAVPVRRGGWQRTAKRLVFSMIPVTVLAAGTEIGFRFYELDKPQLGAPTLVCESAGLHVADFDLFWKLRPNLNIWFQGTQVVTNRQGLRTPEIGPKRDGEFRILSLGESTTFGAGVPNAATYSAVLERYLNDAVPGRFRVINAGVSAYTSFQSLKFLELRGLSLDPDMVLFYHEYNDSLRTTLRDGGPKDELALARTDRELYDTRNNRIHRRLLDWSATYRAISYYSARRSIEKPSEFRDPVDRAGVGRIQTRLPERVPPQDRRRVLAELAAVCRSRHIRLVIIHPAYRESSAHECELTSFCRQEGIAMFDALPALHPAEPPELELFIDGVHPSMAGHERLARSLCDYLLDTQLSHDVTAD